MPEHFDPYHKWLGIAADEQPANYYRLLGIRAFESDPDVITSAADQRMVHVRSFQSGQYSELSQRILNELSAARVCLLDAQKKAVYDQRLRSGTKSPMPPRSGADLEVALPGPPPPVPVAQSSPPILPEVTEVPDSPILSRRSRATRTHDRKTRVYIAAAVTVPVCVLLVLLLIHVLNSEPDRPAPRTERPRPEHAVVRDPAMPRRPSEPVEIERESEPQTETEPEPAGFQPELKFEPKPEPEPELGPEPEPEPDEPGPERPPRSAVVKTPVPPSEDQQEVRRAIDRLYPEPQDRNEALALSNKLAALAEDTEAPTERFVLLRRASELASGAGDTRRMLELLSRIAEEFDVDRLLAQAVMLDALAKGATEKEQIGALVDASAGVIDEAIATERFDLADSLSASVYRACQPSAGREFRVDALARRREVQQLRDEWNKVEAARRTLESDPADEAAHSVLGRWYGFVRDDWDRALPHLAKGLDPALRKLADQELNRAHEDPTAQAELADAWWDQAEHEQGAAQQRVRRRAVLWYQRALPGLSGLSRVNAERRIASALRETEPANDTTAPAKIVPPKKPHDLVVEGEGIGPVVVGASVKEILEALGPPERREDTPHVWLVYRNTRGIDVIFPSGTAGEIRFNPGFPFPLKRGPSIGSSLQDVFAAYGKPVRTVETTRAGYQDRVLYQLPRAWKIVYQSQGVLFWFDGNGRVSQFVVFPK